MTALEEQLSKMVDQLNKTIEQLTSQLNRQSTQNEQQAEQIRILTEKVDYLTTKLFGRKSEKSVYDDQMSLFDEPESFFSQPETTEEETVEEEITYRRKKAKGRKAELIAGLPVKEIHHTLSEAECFCDTCNSQLSEIGIKIVREVAQFIPASLYKEQHIQHSYECLECKNNAETNSIKSSKIPTPVLAHSTAGSSVVAWCLYQKFVLAIPLNRQENEWKSYGLAVPRKTLANWVIRSSEQWLLPMFNRLMSELRSNDIFHADETPYQILQRSDGKAATSQSRIWVTRTGMNSKKPIVLFHSTLSRSYDMAERIFSGYAGRIQCDGYQVYRKLDNVSVVACWAHVRRKFHEAGDINGMGAVGKKFCNDLFDIEREIKELSAVEKSSERMKRSKPIIDQFYSWMTSFHAMKGKLADAVGYALNLKDELIKFLSDGNLELSNNLAERSIRPLTIGRKNWLFSTSERGATANTIIYSLVQTAKENNLNVFKYLTYLLEKLPNSGFERNSDVLSAYLPWADDVQLACR